MDWKPIETAPKDETILAYFPLHGLDESWCRTVPVYWSKSMGWVFASRAASGFSREYQPTHWMPQPDPPKMGGE